MIRPSQARLWLIGLATTHLLVTAPVTVTAFALANKQVSVTQLLQTHADDIAKLKELTAERTSIDVAPYSNDVFYLRHCLDHAEDSAAQCEQLSATLDWRLGPGASICEAATTALAQATADGAWKNDVVFQAAPHYDAISKFISGGSNIITTTTSQGDLVYCVRAGKINDRDLMSAVSVDQMVDFFAYAKEVNCQVINDRSLEQNQLLAVITMNDLAGVKLVGGSSEFRTALSTSSKQAAGVYPESTQGPTILCNLPAVLSALVKLFTPLFPPTVKERIKFVQGPLKEVEDLSDIASASTSDERSKFLQQMDEIVYTTS